MPRKRKTSTFTEISAIGRYKNIPGPPLFQGQLQAVTSFKIANRRTAIAIRGRRRSENHPRLPIDSQ
jgi:hypothetical protein